MKEIEKLSILDLSKVNKTGLKEAIDELLTDYAEATDKEFFVSENQGVIKQYYSWVKQVFPEAIPVKSKPESSKTMKEKSEKKATLSEEEKDNIRTQLDKEVEKCRIKIREHNAKKKTLEGPKPVKSRYTLIKERTVALIKLTPPKLLKDEKVQAKNREMADLIVAMCMENWDMKPVKQAQKAIGKELDELEDKAEKSERKEIAKKWRSSLADIDGILSKVSQDKKLLSLSAKDLKEQLREIVKVYEDDPDKAIALLKEKYTHAQLELYIPAFVRKDLEL